MGSKTLNKPKAGTSTPAPIKTKTAVYSDKDTQRKYTFISTAPKTLNFQGKTWTQDEIVKDEEAMKALIAGHSSFIKPLKSKKK